MTRLTVNHTAHLATNLDHCDPIRILTTGVSNDIRDNARTMSG
jgi:hypothetical protein